MADLKNLQGFCGGNDSAVTLELIMQEVHQIPTGYLFSDDYSKGKLETLSIGDYGKSVNVKADFLGYTREIDGVPNTHCMPLSEKWVITISTQYGCQCDCSFCDVPKVQWRGNATLGDLWGQLSSAIRLFPHCKYTERMNIHFARMGDPIFNPAVFEFSKILQQEKRQWNDRLGIRVETIHPVLTTSLPRWFPGLEARILEWCDIKNEVYHGQAGLQFSINSTNEDHRKATFRRGALTLEELAEIAKRMPDPISRKYCLNFAFSDEYELDGAKLYRLFSPDKFMVKITPIHNNTACRENGIKTAEGYESFKPYRRAEEAAKDAGFDTLVFIPSMDEEDGLVTCGNVVLGGSQLRSESTGLKIIGV